MKTAGMGEGDFINFGTYAIGFADMLKLELEKRGIPVKVLYAGTEVGREGRAQAATFVIPESNAGNTLLIPAGYQKSAAEIRDSLNIKPL